MTIQGEKLESEQSNKLAVGGVNEVVVPKGSQVKKY